MNYQSRVRKPHIDVRRVPTVGRATELWMYLLMPIDGNDVCSTPMAWSESTPKMSRKFSEQVNSLIVL